MIRPTNLNDFAKIVHQANIKWWQNIDTGEPIERNPKELLMLIISEVAECLEGERKNLMDDKLPHRKMAEVEMADTVIRVLDFSAGFKCIIECDFILWTIPKNRGEALFYMCKQICRYEDNLTDVEMGYILNQLIVMIECYCCEYKYDLWGAIEEKMKFNATREDHTHEARRIAGGKQF